MTDSTGGYPSSDRRVSDLRQPSAANGGDYISVPRQVLANVLRRVDPGGFLSPDLEVNWDRDGRLVERRR
jgi:hypothetical protein